MLKAIKSRKYSIDEEKVLQESWLKECPRIVAFMCIRSAGKVNEFHEYKDNFLSQLGKASTSKQNQVKKVDELIVQLESALGINLLLDVGPYWFRSYLENGVEGIKDEDRLCR